MVDRTDRRSPPRFISSSLLFTRSILDSPGFLQSIVLAFLIPLGTGTGLLGLSHPELFSAMLDGNQSLSVVGPAIVRFQGLFACSFFSLLLLLRRVTDTGLFLRRSSFLIATPVLPIVWNRHILVRHLGVGWTLLLCFTILLIHSAQHWFPDLRDGYLPESTDPPSSLPADLLLVASVLLYGIYSSYYTVVRHYQFESAAFDLGLRVNYFWSTLQGEFLRCSYFSPIQHYFCRAHLTLTSIICLGPLYALIPRVETLLVAQSFLLSLGAIPIYMLGKRHLGSRWIALCLALGYLFHPALHGPNFYDFHELAFLPLLGGLVLYYGLENRVTTVLPILPLFLLIKEDMGLLLCLWGLFLLTRRESRAAGTLYVCAGLSWFVFATCIILPRYDVLAPGWNYEEMVPGGGPALAILQSLAVNPLFALRLLLDGDRLLYLAQLSFPLGCFAIFYPPYGLLFLHGAAVTLLASRGPLHQLSFQYNLYWIPGIWTAFILVLEDLRSRRRFNWMLLDFRSLLVAGLGATLLLSAAYGALINREGFRGGFSRVRFEYSAQDRERLLRFRSLVAKNIPPDASLGASMTLCPHLSNRREIQVFEWMTFLPDFLVILGDGGNLGGGYSLLVRTRRYIQIDHDAGFLIYKRVDLPGDLLESS